MRADNQKFQANLSKNISCAFKVEQIKEFGQQNYLEFVKVTSFTPLRLLHKFTFEKLVPVSSFISPHKLRVKSYITVQYNNYLTNGVIVTQN